MTIRNPKTFMQSIWDWEVVAKGVLPGKMRFSDIDGFLERRGCHLFIETKGEGVTPPVGQWEALRSLAQKPNCAVMFIWGQPQYPTKIQILIGKDITPRLPCNLTQLRDFLRQWLFVSLRSPQRMSVSQDASGKWRITGHRGQMRFFLNRP